MAPLGYSGKDDFPEVRCALEPTVAKQVRELEGLRTGACQVGVYPIVLRRDNSETPGKPKTNSYAADCKSHQQCKILFQLLLQDPQTYVPPQKELRQSPIEENAGLGPPAGRGRTQLRVSRGITWHRPDKGQNTVRRRPKRLLTNLI